MDAFTFLMAIVLIILGVSFGEKWIVFGIILLLILTQRSIILSVLLIFAGALIYIIQAFGLSYLWPVVIFGLIILGLMFGIQPQEQAPEMWSPEGGGGGLLGGI